MEKRRIRLEINGVVCGLITGESDEYMQSLAKDAGELMREIQEASPYITREAAALTAALSYCDDAKKNGKKAFDLQERVDELEVEAELWQEEKAEMKKAESRETEPDPALLEKVRQLEQENTALTAAAGELEKLRRMAAGLEDENEALREAACPKPSATDDGELAALREKLAALEAENARLKAAPPAPEQKPAAGKRRRNPLRCADGLEQEGLVSFFEKKE